jgi:hypothetical protein
VSVEADVYDWDAFDRRTATYPRRRGRRGIGAAALAAALWAIDDVVLSEKQRTPVIEEAAMPAPDPDASVVVHLVRGEPRRSWVRC